MCNLFSLDNLCRVGNLRSVFRNGIDYILRFILPVYASFMPSGYSAFEEENFSPRDSQDSEVTYRPVSLNLDETNALGDNTVRNQERRNDDSNAVENIGYFQVGSNTVRDEDCENDDSNAAENIYYFRPNVNDCIEDNNVNRDVAEKELNIDCKGRDKNATAISREVSLTIDEVEETNSNEARNQSCIGNNQGAAENIQHLQQTVNNFFKPNNVNGEDAEVQLTVNDRHHDKETLYNIPANTDLNNLSEQKIANSRQVSITIEDDSTSNDEVRSYNFDQATTDSAENTSLLQETVRRFFRDSSRNGNDSQETLTINGKYNDKETLYNSSKNTDLHNLSKQETVNSRQVSITIEDDSTSNDEVRSQNFNQTTTESAKNGRLLQETLKKFFQNSSMNENASEGNLITIGKKRIKSVPCNFDANSKKNPLNKQGCVKTSKSEELQWNITDLSTDWSNIKVNHALLDSRSNEITGRPSTSIQVVRNSTSSNSTNEGIHGNEDLRTLDKKENIEDKVEPKENLPSNRERKYGLAPTSEILRQRKELIEQHSRNSILNDQLALNEPENDNKDGHECEKSCQRVQKITLNKFHSGGHSLVEEENEHTRLTDYSLESKPLCVDVNTYRSISHPNLQSGGLAVFKELSKHLVIPIYPENTAVCKNLPGQPKIPRIPPSMLACPKCHLHPSVSWSGLSIPCSYENSRKVILPEIYPENHPLLKSCVSKPSTQNSPSFGSLVTPEKVIFEELIAQSQRCNNKPESQTSGSLVTPEREQEAIFEDLLAQSQRYDNMLESQTSGSLVTPEREQEVIFEDLLAQSQRYDNMLESQRSEMDRRSNHTGQEIPRADSVTELIADVNFEPRHASNENQQRRSSSFN